MNSLVVHASLAFGDLAVPKLMAVESATLVVLAATLLVFRTFRERYLLTWILGWLAYFVSGWILHGSVLESAPDYIVGIAQAQFVLALSLFGAAVFIYSHTRKLLLLLLIYTLALMAYAAVRAIIWPDAFWPRVALEIGYRLIAITAAIQLIRFRWARWEIGHWFLSLSLLLIHLDWAPISVHLPPDFSLAADLVFGFSMVLVVFDDSKMRTRRLGVLNSLTTTITRAQQYGPMMETALGELKNLMGARAAWFRLLEGDNSILAQQIGLSQDYVRDRGSIPMDDLLREIFVDSSPKIHSTKALPDNIRPYLSRERLNHVVTLPVLGKKSAIGTLSLGSRHKLSYTPDELEFLVTTAHQLGLAVENLRLVEQILRSHRQWANTFDSIQDVVLLHDGDFRVMKANRALLQRLGQAPADVAGKLCSEVLPKISEWEDCPYCHGDADGFYEAADPSFGGVVTISTSTYVEQGSQQRGTIHVVHDTTERLAAEEKYRLIFEQAQEGVFIATYSGKLLDCNDAFVRMLGYGSREELMAMDLETQLYAIPEQRETFRKEIEAHNYVRNFETTLRRKDGTIITALESSFTTRNSAGTIERYQGFLLDITEKKRAEDEIRRRNRELNALNAMAVIATQSFDLDEILNLTLRQVISLFGAESGSMYLVDADEKTFRRRAGWGQRSADRARLSEIEIAEGFGDLVTRSRAEVLTQEYLPHLPARVVDFLQADGLSNWIWVLLWSKEKPMGMMGISSRDVRQYTSNDENLLVAIGRQLATTIEKVRLYEETCRAYEDLRRTQEQLLQSEKMSAVGQLIAGVAHELNNPLTAILGYAQLLESEGLDEHASDYVSKLFKQAQRTHRVVQNLLSFARQRKPQRQQVEISKVLEDTLTLRDYDLRVSDIKLERDIEPSLPAVTADPHQLEQVFLNVINNALDAMLDKGQGGVLKVRAYAKDGIVHTEFHDSGPGIKEPSRIFEPFYTTKSVGKGTGLGLSICYGIIQEHGGSINARNGQDGGAILDVSLPAAVEGTVSEISTPAAKRDFALEGTVMLFEIEDAVVEFERDLLAGAGAEVFISHNENELKTALQAQAVDAIIMDGKMPNGCSPASIYNWMSETCPQMQKHLLFTFSSLPEPELRDFLNDKNLPYLVKPFEVADLISQTRKLMQKAQAAKAE
jgi:two-component system NtrC family sensor kinase